MVFVEFLEFFGRLAYWVFEHDEGQYRGQPLHLSIDALLAHYCSKLRCQRVHSIIPEAMTESVQAIIDYQKALMKNQVMRQEDSVGLITDSMIEDSQSHHGTD